MPSGLANMLTPDGQADPQCEAAIGEAAQKLFVQLSETNRTIVEMRMFGFSTAEIAEPTRRAPRSIRRVLQMASHHLAKALDC